MNVDYNKCSLNIISSIEKHFGFDNDFKPDSKVLKLLEGYKHVFLVLLDGMGEVIINKNLKEDSFIRTHLRDTFHTVYPPTTVAATTSVLSGKEPSATGWFGWHQYFSEVDKDIVLFNDIGYYDNKKVDFKVKDALKHDYFFTKFSEKGIETDAVFPSFAPNGYKRIKEGLKRLIKISKKDKQTFTYFYNVNPDYTMHEFGCYSKETKQVLNKLDKNLEYLSRKISDDSIVLVIADHGLVDITNAYLEDYPSIFNLLTKEPSIEARTCTFEVSVKEKFKTEFNNIFGDKFKLFTKEEFMNSDYTYSVSGDKSKIDRFIFDFVAVGISDLAINYKRSDDGFEMKAHHAGDTYDEMMIPLIAFTKKEKRK